MAALGANVAHLLDAYGLLVVFVVMLLKELGVPIPIPGDFVMLAAAAQAAAGKVSPWQAFGALVLAMVLGAWGGAAAPLPLRPLRRPDRRTARPGGGGRAAGR